MLAAAAFIAAPGLSAQQGGTITGRIVADLAADRPPPIDARPFRAERFAGHA